MATTEPIILSERRATLLPPDPRAGRLRLGPMWLALFGAASIGGLHAYRDRLRPAAPADGAIAVPTLVEATAAFRPLRSLADALPAAMTAFPQMRQVTPAVDAFAEAPAPPAKIVASPPPRDEALPRLQSVVVGARGRACLIDGRLCRIGDTIAGGIVRAIERDGVTLDLGGRDVPLRLAPPTVQSKR